MCSQPFNFFHAMLDINAKAPKKAKNLSCCIKCFLSLQTSTPLT